jgi:hypothetical protein
MITTRADARKILKGMFPGTRLRFSVKEQVIVPPRSALACGARMVIYRAIGNGKDSAVCIGELFTNGVINWDVEFMINETAAQLRLIWRHTHRDYRCKLPDGTRTVVTLGASGGSELWPLDSLPSHPRYAEKLEMAQRCEARRLAKKAEAQS